MVHTSSTILAASVIIGSVAPAFSLPFKLPEGASPINVTHVPGGPNVVALRDTEGLEARLSGPLKREELIDLEARQFGKEVAGALAGVASQVGATDAIKKAT